MSGRLHWIGRKGRIGRVAAAAVLVAPSAAALCMVFDVVDAAPAHASTYQNSQTLTLSGGPDQYFTVPPSVWEVFFEINGGHGGNGGATGSIVGGAGGAGAEVTGTFGVTPGSTIGVHLGLRGSDGSVGTITARGGRGGDQPNGLYHGGNGGDTGGSPVSGAGGGGGAASTIAYGGELIAVAAGGGGGGGGGDVPTYIGGAGGTGAGASLAGSNAPGINAGSGGSAQTCASTGGSRVGGDGGTGANLGAGGGGGGGGYDGTVCGGGGGQGGNTAFGGGGGAAGASYAQPDLVTGAQSFSAGNAADGSVTFAWAQPTTSMSLKASSYATLAHFEATVSPSFGVSGTTETPAPSGTVNFTESIYGSEFPIGSATVVDGVATLTTSNLAPGTYDIVANYSGDDVYAPSSTLSLLTFSPAKVHAVATGSVDSNPVPFGGFGTVSASISPPAGAPSWLPAPTGTLALTDVTGANPVPLGSVNIQAGDSNTLLVSDNWTASASSYSFEVDYSGDALYAGDTPAKLFSVAVAMPPTAHAGPDQSVRSGATFTVDGSTSTDPQGEPLTYAWSQVDGPAVTFADKTKAQTKVTAPSVSTRTTVHLRLTVTNSAGLSSTSTMAVTISPK